MNMGWLDANEYLLMEAVARDRVDGLRATLDLALASADAEPICEICKGRWSRSLRWAGSAWADTRSRLRSTRPTADPQLEATGSRGSPRCRQPSIPAASGRMRVMPFLRKRSATRALVASFGQLQ